MAKLLFLGGRFFLGPDYAGAKCYFYVPGTADPKTTYADEALTIENSNPLVLDANGSGVAFLNGDYKVVINTADDAETLYTQDGGLNIEEALSFGAYNEVSNPSFEVDSDSDSLPDNWTRTLFGTAADNQIDTSDSYHGVQSLKCTSGGSGGSQWDSDPFDVTPGETIEVGFALLSSVVDVHNVVELRWLDVSGNFISASTIYDDATANPTTWARQTVVAVTPPATARRAFLRLVGCHPDDATAGSTWFDDIIVRRGGSVEGLLSTAGDGQTIVRDTDGTPTVWAPKNYIAGLTISNNGTDPNNDIDIAVGEASDDDGSVIMKLTGALTKQLDAAWAAGTNMGGLFSGAKAADTWYHVFLIMQDSSGICDAGFSTDVAPTFPAGYSGRRIGSILTDGSSNILAFVANEWAGGAVRYIWEASVADHTGLTAGSPTKRALTVPTGINVLAKFTVADRSATPNIITHILCQDGVMTAGESATENHASASYDASNVGGITGADAAEVEVLTDTSAQVWIDITDTSGAGAWNVQTHGWTDSRL